MPPNLLSLKQACSAGLVAVLLGAVVAIGAPDSAWGQDEPAADSVDAEVDSGVNDADAADEVAKDTKKKKKKKKDDELPVCGPDDPPTTGDGEESATGGLVSDGEDGAEPTCTPAPRCGANEVDLAPNADDPSCIGQSQLNALVADFEATAAEEAEALAELAEALDVLDTLRLQLLDLRARMGEVQLRLAAAKADAGFAAIRAATAKEGMDDVAAVLATEEDLLRTQAVEAYIGGGQVEAATSAAMLDLEDYSALETAQEYASAVLGTQLDQVDRVESLRNAVDALGAVVAGIEAEAADTADHVAEIESTVGTLLNEQARLVSEAELEAEAVAERIAEIQSRKQDYAEQLRVQGAGGGSIGEALRVSQAGQEPPAVSVGLLAMPLENTVMGSPFGPRVHPIFGDARLHAGIDMSGNAGDPILASAEGIVVLAEPTSGYGNVVVVDHGNTIATLYAHMTADAVNVGQRVAEGELLGFVGSTGFSTGPHLHFEVRLAGTPVDPMLYLRPPSTQPLS